MFFWEEGKQDKQAKTYTEQRRQKADAMQLNPCIQLCLTYSQ